MSSVVKVFLLQAKDLASMLRRSTTCEAHSLSSPYGSNITKSSITIVVLIIIFS